MVSVVIPVRDEQETIPTLAGRLRDVLGPIGDFEVIFVNDGSTDATAAVLHALHDEDKRFKSLHLTRNFGHQAAIMAGLRAAAGDAVVVMDGDLQDPPETIPAFLARWREGHDVVYGVRTHRPEGWAKRAAYSVFYRVLSAISQTSTPVDSGDFALMDRRVVDLLGAMPEQPRFLRGLRSWVGFRQVGVEVVRDARHAGRPKFTLLKLVRLALDGFFSMSHRPLQLASLLGFAVSGLALGLGLLLALLKIFHGIPLLGWTSLMVGVLFLGGVQLICLGILGEYLGRVYEETRHRPAYFIATVVGETRVAVPAAGRRAE
jgi:dolichol-phosphate mannosyltransferase